MSENKLNLYQKLHKIQCEIIGLGKNKKGNNYEYVTGSKVLEHIKPLMNQLGLILKQEVLSIENVRQDFRTGIGTQYEKDKSEILSKVMMRFTWVDCESGDKDENLFGANGQNEWEKGLGSALTYSERYFLLKYFHISTDEDDIDNPDRQGKEPEAKKTPQQKPQEPKPENELPWLNKMDKEKNFTKQWMNLLTGIEKGTVKSMTDVRKFYKVSKEIQADLDLIFTLKNKK